MDGPTLKEGAGLLNGWFHIEGRVYWMASSTLKHTCDLIKETLGRQDQSLNSDRESLQ